MMFTIIFPVLNERLRLESGVTRTVEYLQSIAFEDYEIIIVDNGSEDETPQIAENLCKKYDGRLRRTVSSDDDRRIYFLCSVLPFDGKDITEAWTESFTGALYNACTGHVHWSFSVVVVMESGGSGI